MTAWSYLTTDIATGAILSQAIPMVGVTYSEVLNGAGQATGSIDLADPNIDPVEMAGKTQRGRTGLYILADGVIQWGGQIMSSQYSSTDRLLKLTARSWWGYLSSLVVDPAISGTLTTTIDLAVGQVLGHAKQWHSQHNQFTYTPFPNDYPGLIRNPTLINQLTYTAPTMSFDLGQWAGKTVATVIEEMSRAQYPNGFDFGHTWPIDSSYTGSPIPIPTLNIYYPQRGTEAPPFNTFVYSDVPTSGNVSSYTFPDDASGAATDIAAFGAGTASAQIYALNQNSDLVAAGYPMSVLTPNYSGTADPTTLATYAAGEADAADGVPAYPTLTVRTDQVPTLGSYQVGDEIQARICDPYRFPTPGKPEGTFGHDQVWRIQQTDTTPAGQNDEQVVLTLTSSGL